MLRAVVLRAQGSLARCAACRLPAPSTRALLSVVFTSYQPVPQRLYSTSDASSKVGSPQCGAIVSTLTQDIAVKDTLVGGSAYLSSVASDVYALQDLFRSLASDSVVAHNFERCVESMLQCHDQQNRVYVTGMGKSGAVAQRLASTLSSISISSQWIHGGEWVHGELGGLKHGDMVIIVSHSGRTKELLPLPDMFRKAGCGVMAIVGDGRSPLSKNSDLAIVAPAKDEVDCPVPSRSIIVQEAICNAIVQHLVENMADGADHLKESHPGGAIGARFAN